MENEHNFNPDDDDAASAEGQDASQSDDSNLPVDEPEADDDTEAAILSRLRRPTTDVQREHVLTVGLDL